MGFFSKIFNGGNVALQDPLPIQTVTVEKKKKNRYGGDGKENIDINKPKSKNKKRGWVFNKKKEKGKGKKAEAPVETPALKLSIFLQQNSEPDEESLNHTIDTGSLTASLTASLTTTENQPQHHVDVRPVTPMDQTRPPSAAGVSQPLLKESFPMDGVDEAEDSDSSSSHEEMKQPLHSSINDPLSDTEKSDNTAETAEDLDLSPSPVQQSSPLHQSISVSMTDIPDMNLSEVSPPLYQEAELSDPAASLHSDESSDGASVDAIEALNKLTAELTAELDTMPKVEPIELSVAESVSLADSEDAAVEYLESDQNDEDSANADLLFFDLEESSTNIADLLDPVKVEFDAKTLEQDYFTAVNSELAIDNATFGNDSANADLGWKSSSDDEEDDSPDRHYEFDLNFLNKEHQDMVKDEAEAVEVKKEDIENEIKNSFDSFDQIVNEVEETIANAQKQQNKGNNWIPNGLMTTVRDDSSLGQNSTFSFTSDDFKEEDSEVHHHVNPMKTGLGCTTITEEAEDENSEDPMDAAIERGMSKSQGESDDEDVEERESAIESLRETLTNVLDPTPMNASPSIEQESNEPESTPWSPVVTSSPMSSALRTTVTPSLPSAMNHSMPFSTTRSQSLPLSSITSLPARPKSALRCSKNLSRPTMRKSVSWRDDNEVFNYLPPQAADLQKARDLVATYERLMSALNSKRPSSANTKSSLNSTNDDEKSNSSASDADLSEASSTSSIESLLSALSNASSASSESMKIAIQQITQETEKLVSQQFDNREEVKEGARNDMLENNWPETVETTNTSSSSIESLLSALSQASSNSGDSVKMVVQKLKEEAEQRVLLTSQQLEEEKERISRERSYDSSSSVSSSSFSSAPSMASSAGTSESVKKLMKELNSERTKQAQVFCSTRDMFTLLHNKQNNEQARVQMISNDWIEGLESGSSSSLSSLLSASPCSSQSTNDSSESVQLMMKALKRETERHKERRKKIRSVREFVDNVCISSSQMFSDSSMSKL